MLLIKLRIGSAYPISFNYRRWQMFEILFRRLREIVKKGKRISESVLRQESGQTGNKWLMPRKLGDAIFAAKVHK